MFGQDPDKPRRRKAIARYGGYVGYAREFIARAWRGECCIYCGSYWPGISVDHVMPRAMGTFQDNWTLDCVCDACNNYFSKLELPLGRDSVEAMRRIDHGVKPPDSALDFHYNRLTTTVIESDRHKGLRVVMMPDGDDVTPTAAPQVGFLVDNKWTFLTEAELASERIAESGPGRFAMQIIAPSGAGHARLLARLSELGIRFEQETQALGQNLFDEGKPLQVEFLVNVDRDLLRGATKIGFNYATRMLGVDTIRLRAFDAARRYIRCGEELVFLASAEDMPVLSGTNVEGRHVCALAWSTQDGLVAVVCLFNHVTYKLRLCPRFHGEFETMRHAHVFDPIDHKIFGLSGSEVHFGRRG